MAENGTLSLAQNRALQALLSERDVRSAAKSAGVGERSLWRWLQDPTFQEALTQQEGQLLDQATRRLLALQAVALATFEAVLTSSTATDANKLRAAQCVLDYSLKLRELNSLEARLAELEDIAREQDL